MTDADLTLKIITNMRDEAHAFRNEARAFREEMLQFRADVYERFERLEVHAEVTNSRLEIIEHTVTGHTQQLASIAKLVNNTATRREVAELRTRVEKLESE